MSPLVTVTASMRASVSRLLSSNSTSGPYRPFGSLAIMTYHTLMLQCEIIRSLRSAFLTRSRSSWLGRGPGGPAHRTRSRLVACSPSSTQLSSLASQRGAFSYSSTARLHIDRLHRLALPVHSASSTAPSRYSDQPAKPKSLISLRCFTSSATSLRADNEAGRNGAVL